MRYNKKQFQLSATIMYGLAANDSASGGSDDESQPMTSPPSRYTIQPDLAQPEEVQILSPSSSNGATSPIVRLTTEPLDGAHSNAAFSTSPSIENGLSSSPTDRHQEAAASLNGDHSREPSPPRQQNQQQQQQQPPQPQFQEQNVLEEEQEESKINIFFVLDRRW